MAKLSSATNEFNIQKHLLLDEVLNLISELKIPVFLVDGSLLGVIRDNKFLEKDSDHDIGIRITDLYPHNISLKKFHDFFISKNYGFGFVNHELVSYTNVFDLSLTEAGILQIWRPKNLNKNTINKKSNIWKVDGNIVYCDILIYFPFIYQDKLTWLVNENARNFIYSLDILEPLLIKYITLENKEYPILENSEDFIKTVYANWKIPGKSRFLNKLPKEILGYYKYLITTEDCWFWKQDKYTCSYNFKNQFLSKFETKDALIT